MSQYPKVLYRKGSRLSVVIEQGVKERFDTCIVEHYEDEKEKLMCGWFLNSKDAYIEKEYAHLSGSKEEAPQPIKKRGRKRSINK